jgi:hypothetical protein
VIEWWSQQQASMIGALAGTGVGVLGGVLGSLIGWCAPRGVLKTPVIGAQALTVGGSFVALVLGGYANLAGQPYHVYYPLMLAGAVGLGVMGGLLPVTLWAYRSARARKQSPPTSASDPNFRAPSPALIEAILACWGEGGSLRALSLRLGWAMLAVALVSIATGAVVLSRGAPMGSFLAWGMVAIGTGVGAVVCLALPRVQLTAANHARAVLDQQRLAAEELRRG